MYSIESSGHSLGFAMDEKVPNPIFFGGSGVATVVTEARIINGHQKEAIIHEGENGPKWRIVSDEGKHLNGTDLAPFPLGFFNAGLHTDLMARLMDISAKKKKSLGNPEFNIRNFYWFTGSFATGTGEGFADPTKVKFSGEPDLLKEAVRASPAFDALSRKLTNTFALYVNGRRENLSEVSGSIAKDAIDPYKKYENPPKPFNDNAEDFICKTGMVEEGESKPAKASTDTRVIRTVSGTSRVASNGLLETDTWLEMPGVSHFSIRGKISEKRLDAPSGLAFISAGIAFCYLTQLSRYIQHMKLDIGGARLVQFSPFKKEGLIGTASPIDTHLFLNGRADSEIHANLLRISERTCYLHATLNRELPALVEFNKKT